MTVTVKRLLFEAYRRNDMPDPHEKAKPILKRWLGLGTAAAYRPVLVKGLMRFHDDKAPSPRCMGWLCLTADGVTATRQYEEEFKFTLNQLKADTSPLGYSQSYRAQYMTAGGIALR